MSETEAPDALILDLFEQWNEALQTGDPQAVAACYDEGAVLLPTVSNEPRRTPAAIAEYFAHFLKLHPVGRIVDATVHRLCPTAAVFSGLYTFEVDGPGGRVDVPARFTFVYEHGPDGWRILEHHSSGMPEVPVG